MSKDSRIRSLTHLNGVFNLISQASALGNVISAVATENFSFEPLPYSDYSSFEEIYNESNLRINRNPHATHKFIFIPSLGIKVDVIADKKHSSNAFSSNIYTIKLTHNNYEWEVLRTYKDLRDNHKILTKIVKEDLGRSCSQISSEEIKPEWPLFPMDSDHSIPSDSINLRCKHIAEYLEKMLLYPPFRDNPSTLKLIGVSPLTFIPGLEPSLFENTILKSTGNSLKVCDYIRLRYSKRWFVLKDSYIVYLNPHRNYLVGFVMLIDTNFSVTKKKRIKAINGLEIKNLQHKIFLKFKHNQDQCKWFNMIEHCMKNTGKYFIDKSLLPNGSYAPVRRKQLCKWYINSAQYMEHVMLALNNAKEEIFITDWWLSPELYLKRPTEDLQYRLDKILLKKSREGVKIYILLFKEIKFTVPILSSRTKNILTQNKMNPNIKVFRHPEHSPSGVFLWTHHEKMVIIDQSVAFLGGIDLCYGRWDDDLHRLVDLGRKENRPIQDNYPRNNYEPSISDIITTEPAHLPQMQMIAEETTDEIGSNKFCPNKNDEKRYSDSMIVAALMGYSLNKQFSKNSRVNLGFMSDTPAQTLHPMEQRTSRSYSYDPDLSKEKIQISYITPENNEIENNKSNQMSKESVNDTPMIKNKWREFKKTLTRRRKNFNTFSRFRQSKNSSSEESVESIGINEEGSFLEERVERPAISNEGYYWYGKDYANNYKADFKNVEEFWSDQFDRTETPRMPWRDQGLVVIGESARDLARHFIQRWNQCKKEKARYIESYPFLLPKSYPDSFKYNYEWFKDTFYKCEVQMTRSFDKWSGGISETEFSIYKSYIDLIQRAENYIYIENQFFVTTTDSDKDPDVKNLIGAELVRRIQKAFLEKKNFRVYIVLPLLPGFDKPNAIQAVQYYNLRSIINGEFSIIKKLKSIGIADPSKYITFHGMRNWSDLMGKLVQEIIYVHSKLMIVDDKYVICGSANLNDRSMLGKRDSEVAAVIKDEELFASVLDGEQVLVGKYANSLRKKIFKLHLGIYFNNPKKIDVQDCVSDEFYEYFRSVSKKNTQIYDEVFKCLPSDNITDFQILSSYTQSSALYKTDPLKGKRKLEEEVNGFIVDFPLLFLSKESYFFPDIRTPEGIIPVATWT
ncbi:unnamed protein product [Brachionus calyciflorus]|uniref:Phospholipase n=1 Tax=Brachionus calyciflorus TaxID=104777 RepID=A0A813N1A6_9BILA|nr:unnamed protein product [Brachionus calyciflorus]